MARSHASASSSIALGFAVVYSLVYVPSEMTSLESFQNLYLNLTNATRLNQDDIQLGAWSGGIGDEWKSPIMINNAIQFYYFRIIARLCLVFLMSMCIAAFICSRICIPDEFFQVYFHDYMFEELRGLHRVQTHVGTLLMRRLINVDPFSSFAANVRNQLPVEGKFSVMGAVCRTSVLLPYIVSASNPFYFIFLFIPTRVIRYLFPKSHPPPQPFLVLQRACFQVILYHDNLRRSVTHTFWFRDLACLLGTSCYLPRRLLRVTCSAETLEVLDDIHAIIRKFPIEQRIHLYQAIMCHSNYCLFVVAFLYLLLFLHNTLSSELVVAYWFSIPHSQIKATRNDTNYNLFFNYRELTNWEYIVNDHFLFLLFFAVNLTCTNSTMFLVLAPTFFVTAAGLYSNHTTTIDLGSIDSWFIISLFIAYMLSFITNALTYRDVCEMFVNRAKDSAFVSDNTMLELSHEFMSLSCITLEAMEECCSTTSTSNADLIRCMMWLLRKQRLHVHLFQPSSISVLPANRRALLPQNVSIRKLLSEEFEPVQASSSAKLGSFGAMFASACKICHCDVEFKHDLGESVDLTVCCAESEMRHFMCAFLCSVLSSASHSAGFSRIRVSVKMCRASDLNKSLTQTSRSNLLVLDAEGSDTPRSNRRIARAHSLHRVSPLPVVDADMQYVQFVAELLEMEPFDVSSAREHLSWIESFFELDNFAVLEFVTRMQGSIQIPRKEIFEIDHILGACALPCALTTIPTSDLPPTSTLRILIIEDQALLFNHLISKIKRFAELAELPFESLYSIDHATNVADAVVKFSTDTPNIMGKLSSFPSNRIYDIVLIDRFMPMAEGLAPVPEAGVEASRILREIEREKGFSKCIMVRVFDLFVILGFNSVHRSGPPVVSRASRTTSWRCVARG